MTDSLRNLLKQQQTQEIATAYGLRMHARLQHLDLSSDDDIAIRVSANPDLAKLFDDLSRAEVPIAGYVRNRFVSRRIDRLRIDNANKQIDILDFKTDTDADLHRHQYQTQIHEYAELLRSIYPEYEIRCHILWVHNWVLEQI